MSDTPVDSLIQSAEEYLFEAETHLGSGDDLLAVAAVEQAIENLQTVGAELISSIDSSDLSELEGSSARILRTLAERFGILPESYLPVLSGVPETEMVLQPNTIKKAQEPQSISGVIEVVRQVYTTDASPETELSEEEGVKYLSAISVLLELLRGKRSLSDAVFADGGAYDSFTPVVEPYLVLGAAYASGNQDIADSQEKIAEMLSGPVKRLIRLLFALLTSAFISGLILLLIKRVIAVRRLRPGIIDTTIFAGNVLSLIVSNIPMFIEGTRAVLIEMKELQQILNREDQTKGNPVE